MSLLACAFRFSWPNWCIVAWRVPGPSFGSFSTACSVVESGYGGDNEGLMRDLQKQAVAPAAERNALA